MEKRLAVPEEEQSVLFSFNKFLSDKKIDKGVEDSEFVKLFYEFFKAGWIAKQNRVDTAIDQYFAKSSRTR